MTIDLVLVDENINIANMVKELLIDKNNSIIK